jgi:hypothetical protein
VGLARHVGDLGLQRRDAIDRAAGVVGHVDDRRHAAGRGRPGGPLDSLLCVAARMDVDVHRAGEQQRVTEVRRAPTGLADAVDATVGNRQAGAGRGSVSHQDAAGNVLDH